MATKRKAVKKKGVGLPGTEIDIEIDLGPMASVATDDQKARLRAYVENIVLTWAAVDANTGYVPVFCRDIPTGPPPPSAAKRPGK